MSPSLQVPRESTLVVVGALCRIDRRRRSKTVAALNQIHGVSTFDLPEQDEHRCGLLVEARTLESVHELIGGCIKSTAGVLAVWPVSIEVDEADQTQILDHEQPERSS